MLNDFSKNMNQHTAAMYAAIPTTYSYPNLKYVEERPATVNYLVNTSKGMVQCRVTDKNFVFCM